MRSCSRRVIRISDLAEFTDRAGRHARSLVFPYWFGQNSRSRHGLVPAICEANGMMFVGADAFAKIVCNDKELAKSVCRDAGLPTPRSGVVRELGDLSRLRGLRLPVIVKPNYEGTSLGVGEDNKCADWTAARTVAERLLNALGQPVVVEEFIRGREFSACLMASGGRVHVRAGSWTIDGREDYLDDRVFSAELKTVDREMSFKEGLSLPPMMTGAMERCFRGLGKVDILRIDGRLDGTEWSIIELTPDIYLGSDGEFARCYSTGPDGYEGFVSYVVRNCIEGYGAQFPM